MADPRIRARPGPHLGVESNPIFPPAHVAFASRHHLRTVAVMDALSWTLAVLLVLAGMVGSVVPLLPGTTLILAGALLQKILLPTTIGWSAVGWIGLLWLLSIAADFACTLLGTRLLGGSKWGMAGASGGALAGMFFSLPALLVGTIFGAIAAEKLGAKRTDGDAIKSGLGAALGFVAGTIVRIFFALAMVALFVGATWESWSLPGR